MDSIVNVVGFTGGSRQKDPVFGIENRLMDRVVQPLALKYRLMQSSSNHEVRLLAVSYPAFELPCRRVFDRLVSTENKASLKRHADTVEQLTCLSDGIFSTVFMHGIFQIDVSKTAMEDLDSQSKLKAGKQSPRTADEVSERLSAISKRLSTT